MFSVVALKITLNRQANTMSGKNLIIGCCVFGAAKIGVFINLSNSIAELSSRQSVSLVKS